MINNNNIFNHTIEEFNKNKAIQLKLELEENEKNIDGFIFDKFVKFKYQKKDLVYYITIKHTLNDAVIALLLQYKKILPHPLLLMTGYVNTNKAEELKNNNIQFMDTAGNAYIDCYPIYIFIKGNKRPDIFFKNTKYRTFEPGGLKIIYTLLCYPDMVKKPYRYIAEIANVALGTVGWTINDLMDLGFIVKIGDKGRQLLRKKELFNRWCMAYSEKLKPKLFINRFMGPEDWWTYYKLDPECAQWGGEIAANKLTKYIKPRDIIIYADPEKYKNIVIENRLRKDTNGNINFFNRFWKFDKANKLKDIVDPILIYADLINTNNQRTLETARMIYEKYIDRRIGKN